MVKYFLLTISLMTWFTAFSQSIKPFFLGHSLINFEMPNMVNRLAEAAGKDYNYKLNIGNGANLNWHYNHPTTGQGDTWTTALPEGGFTHFIMTEAVPLKGHLQWSKTYEYADTFTRYAAQFNPNIKTYIYETWHCINSGNNIGCEWDNDDHIGWRTRLGQDKELWSGIVEKVKEYGNQNVFMVPGGQGMALLYDVIYRNQFSGINNINQIYSDDIHLTLVGNYYIACIMYATIFRESPEGLPNRLKNQWEVLYDQYPTLEQPEILQKLAWQTVCENDISGVNCAVNSIESTSKSQTFVVFSNGKIYTSQEVEYLRVLNLEGKVLANCSNCKEVSLQANAYNSFLLVEIINKGNKEIIKVNSF